MLRLNCAKKFGLPFFLNFDFPAPCRQTLKSHKKCSRLLEEQSEVVPRDLAGIDDRSSQQVLCWLCHGQRWTDGEAIANQTGWLLRTSVYCLTYIYTFVFPGVDLPWTDRHDLWIQPGPSLTELTPILISGWVYRGPKVCINGQQHELGQEAQ